MDMKAVILLYMYLQEFIIYEVIFTMVTILFPFILFIYKRRLVGQQTNHLIFLKCFGHKLTFSKGKI